ncbi:outer membrane lipoprotein-sorting protein [Prosthecobacter sp.]|uniref:outer membrane lipoprotein-sorting protein n=1 Tax=Prosthecobacter sp. TaxID=1965333 RepID=UPI0037850079
MKCLFFATLLLTPLLRAADTPPKTAEEILRTVRQNYAHQNQKLQGELRDGDSGRTEPMELTMGNEVMNFVFTNPPVESIRLDFSTTPATLYQTRKGATNKVPSSQLGSQVRGMDFNYEDLSLGFLYWPRPELMQETRVSKLKCWVVRVMNPGKASPYHAVDIYVHQASGTALRMMAYDQNSKVIKHYEVISAQKVNGVQALKELRVETLDPATGKVTGRTYMTMKPPAKP